MLTNEPYCKGVTKQTFKYILCILTCSYLWKDIMHHIVHYEYLYNALYIKNWIVVSISVSKKCFSFELSIYQSILKNKISFHKNMKQHNSSTLIVVRTIINNWAPEIIDNNWAANQHIRMISEGSCDTEDWSNDAENSALIIEINYMVTYSIFHRL